MAKIVQKLCKKYFYILESFGVRIFCEILFVVTKGGYSMRFFLESERAKKEFAMMLASKMDDSIPTFVCIGSDRVVSDMVAPLVAEMLVKNRIEAYVYGRLNNPIVSSNLNSAMRYIEGKHKDSKIIVIDAGVGNLSDIGSVKLNSCGCVPAGVYGANVRVYGDISIMPIVSTIGLQNKMFLQCARVKVVYDLARNIADSIIMAVDIARRLKTMAI